MFNKDLIRKRIKICLALVVFLSVIFYSHMFYTSGIEAFTTSRNSTVNQCVTLEEWVDLIKITVLVDSLVAIIIPFIIIALMNMLVVYKLMKMRRMMNIRKEQSSEIQMTNLNRVEHDNSISTARSRNVPNLEASSCSLNTISKIEKAAALTTMLPSSLKKKRMENYMRSIRNLLIVTLVNLTLSFPIAVLKMYSSIAEIAGYEHEPTASVQTKKETRLYFEIAERLSCNIYYLIFCLNFLVYVLNYKNIRFSPFFLIEVFIPNRWRDAQVLRTFQDNVRRRNAVIRR
jgi:hypothetical protein